MLSDNIENQQPFAAPPSFEQAMGTDNSGGIMQLKNHRQAHFEYNFTDKRIPEK